MDYSVDWKLPLNEYTKRGFNATFYEVNSEITPSPHNFQMKIRSVLSYLEPFSSLVTINFIWRKYKYVYTIWYLFESSSILEQC